MHLIRGYISIHIRFFTIRQYFFYWMYDHFRVLLLLPVLLLLLQQLNKSCSMLHIKSTRTTQFQWWLYLSAFILSMKEMKLQYFRCENAIIRMELSFVNLSLCLASCKIHSDAMIWRIHTHTLIYIQCDWKVLM